MESVLAVMGLVVVGYFAGAVKIVNQGNQALVERLGKYHRKLDPGLSLVVPFLDSIVLEDTVREQVLDIKPQSAITQNNVSLEVDAVVFWRVLDLERSYYAIEDIEQAIRELVLTTLRSEIGKMPFEETFSSRDKVNKALLDQLDDATESWGVKVTRVEVQEIKPTEEDVLKSMQLQQAAEIKKRAAILEAEGDRKATVERAQGTVDSMRMLSNALDNKIGGRDLLNFLVAQSYVEANQKLGESTNSKVLFMDPKALTEGVLDLMQASTTTPPPEDTAGNAENGHN